MTMITPSYLGETIEYSSLHACRSTLEDPTVLAILRLVLGAGVTPAQGSVKPTAGFAYDFRSSVLTLRQFQDSFADDVVLDLA